jgi:putative ABC transport system permease protein
MRSWLRDLAVAARGLAGTPGFTLVAVLTLALGNGAVTALFTIADTVLLKPLPYTEPDRLVRVFGATPAQGEERDSTSMPDYLDTKRESRTLAGLSGFIRWSYNLTSDGPAQRVWGSYVTADLFETLRAKPVLGRVFLPEEDRPGENRVTVLGYGLWQSLFGGTPDVIGRKLRLDDVEHTVVGVMPQGFEFPSDAQLWIPFGLPEGMPRAVHFLRLVGRMAPGVSVEQARSELAAIARRLELAYPDSNTGREVRLLSLREHLVGDVRPALLVLLGAAGLLLLIACANVANLLLARFFQRQGETALRRALGASRARLFGQAFAEAALISAAGAALGLALAAVAVRVLVALELAQENPSFLADRLHDVPRLDQIGLDGRVVAFEALAGLVTAVIVSLLPALQLSERSLMRVLTGVGKGGVGGSGGGGLRLRRGFVVVQVALALTLVIAAGLLIRSFSRLMHLDPGFRSDHVVTFQLSLPITKYQERQQVADYCAELLRRIAALPGVVSAGLTWSPPLGGLRATSEVDVEGHPATAGQTKEAALQPASAHYFRTLGIPLVRGRFFTERDDGRAAPVVIVNQTLARRFWPGEDPLGRRVTVEATYGPSIAVEGVKREVVGVVADFKGAGLAREADAEMYFPYPQVIWRMMSIVVRTQGDPLGLAGGLRREVRELDGNVAVFQLRTMDQVVSQAVARPRFNTTLLAIFAAVSLVLAAIGVYGIVSYSVSLRSHEIGIRMALGARRRDVLLQVLRQGTLLTLAGLLAGTLGALVLTRSLSGLLFGVEPTDPLTFVSVAAFFFLVAVLASYVPARRATRVDPLVALREP